MSGSDAPGGGKIEAFAVYNMNYGTREDNEEERCFVFHPSDVAPHLQAQHVGLAAGMTNFTRQFTGGVAAHGPS